MENNGKILVLLTIGLLFGLLMGLVVNLNNQLDCECGVFDRNYFVINSEKSDSLGVCKIDFENNTCEDIGFDGGLGVCKEFNDFFNGAGVRLDDFNLADFNEHEVIWSELTDDYC